MEGQQVMIGVIVSALRCMKMYYSRLHLSSPHQRLYVLPSS